MDYIFSKVTAVFALITAGFSIILSLILGDIHRQTKEETEAKHNANIESMLANIEYKLTFDKKMQQASFLLEKGYRENLETINESETKIYKLRGLVPPA
jgi:hypothetical protein